MVAMRPFALFVLLSGMSSVAFGQAAPNPQNAASPAKANPFQGGQIASDTKPVMRYAPDVPAEDTRTAQERCEALKDKQTAMDPDDAVGVDFKIYMGQMRQITYANWKPLMPKEANRPFNKKGHVTVCFALLPNGQVEPKSMVLLGRSGDTALDRAAWGAIQTSVFPPLPAEYKKPRLQLRFDFIYNPNVRPDPVRNMVKPPEIPGPLALTLGYSAKK